MKLRLQGPHIDFKSEGTKIALYLVSPGGASMVDDAWREIFVFGSLERKQMPFQTHF